VVSFIAKNLSRGRDNDGDMDYLERVYDSFGPVTERMLAASSTRRKILTTAPVRAAAVVRVLYDRNEEFVTSAWRQLCAQDDDALPILKAFHRQASAVGSPLSAAGETGSRDLFVRGWYVFDFRNRHRRDVRIVEADRKFDEARRFIHGRLYPNEPTWPPAEAPASAA
jgi:hypothetical protein